MTRTRVLFVDDEANVLDGLRNVLRKQRNVWDMAFAIGAQAALDELARQPADVVVSDMRMPGFDGAALLQQVRDLYPSTARIVLSGHAEREAVMRALPVAHQYLSKPCEAEQLVAVIERTYNLQALLHDEAVRGIVAGLSKLPSVPQAYLAITQAAGEPNTTLDDIARIVERDPALVVKILQIVNSAYFGLRQRLTSIRQAVQYLGLDIIKGLALTGQVFGTLKIAPFEGFSIENLQRHSLMTARLAEKVARGFTSTDDVFTAAIVHDIGKLVLASGFRTQYAEVRRAARTGKRPFHELETEVFGASHAEIGAYLLGMWGLPFAIVEATAFHHRPGLVTSGDRSILAAVHLADALIGAAEPGRDDKVAEQRMDVGFLDASGIVPDLAGWSALARQELQAVG